MSSTKQCLGCHSEIQSDNATGFCGHCIAGLLGPQDDQPDLSLPVHKRDQQNLVGSTIAQYEVKRLIAMGGMGAVYEVYDSKNKRFVALKKIHDSMAWSPASIARFHGEAKAAAELSHPNIVSIIEIGEDHHTPFYTMKLIKGHSLADEKALPLSEDPTKKEDNQRSQREIQIAECIAKIAHALHHAHSHAILHRDIKPSNILIDQNGEPYITDFGLAKRISGDIDLTQTGMMVGTPDYMAPEQIRDDLGPASITTDIYSLGTVLYQQLSGTPPFRADSHVKIFQNIINNDPVPPTLSGRKINNDLSLICLKCLQKDPKDRYTNALEFAEELERWVKGEPLTVRPDTPGKKIIRTVRRHPIQATLATIIILLTLFILGQREWNNGKLHKEQAQTRLVNKSLHGLVAKNRLNRAAELFIQSDSPTAIANLSAVVRDQLRQDTSRDNLFYLMSSIANRRFPLQVCPPLQHKAEIMQLAFHPSGRYLASSSSDGNIRIWDLTTGTLAIPEIEHGGQVYRIEFSPNGKHVLAASYNNTARIWDVETGNPVSDWMRHSKQIDTARYSPGGRWIVTTGFDCAVKLWDARIGAQVPVVMNHPIEEYGVHVAHFVPNRDQLLTASVKGRIRIWSIPSGRLIKEIDTGENYLTDVLIDPTGERFVNLGKPRIGVWRIHDWKKERQLEQNLDSWTGQFSADGERLITADQHRHNETHVWNISNGKINSTLEFKGIRGIGLIAKRNESRWFSIARDQVYSWSDLDGRSLMPPVQAPAAIKSITVDPAHEQIAIATADQSVHIWTTPAPSSNYRTPRDQEITYSSLIGTTEPNPQVYGWDQKDQSFVLQGPGMTSVKRIKKESVTEVESIIPSHLGNFLATRCLKDKNYAIAIYNHKTGKQHYHECKMGSLSATFSYDDRLLLYEEDHDHIRVINSETGGHESELLTLGEELGAGTFNGDGSEVFLSYDSNVIGRWDIKSSKLVDQFEQAGGTITGITHAPNENQITTVADDGILRCWTTSTPPVLKWKSPKLGQILATDYSHSGSLIITSTASGNIFLWNSNTGQQQGEKIPHEDQVYHFQFTPDERVLMTVTADHLVHFWNPRNGLAISESLPWEGHWQSATLSSDGKFFSRTIASGQIEIRQTPGAKPLGPPPKWFAPFTEALVGIRLSSEDIREAIGWNERIDILRNTHTSMELDNFTEWSKMILQNNGFTPYFENR